MQSPSKAYIPFSKISCLACRAAKVHILVISDFPDNNTAHLFQRRCDTPDTETTCRRCKSQDLLCEYKQHCRGIKRKLAAEDRPPSTARSEGTSAATDTPTRLPPTPAASLRTRSSLSLLSESSRHHMFAVTDTAAAPRMLTLRGEAPARPLSPATHDVWDIFTEVEITEMFAL
jgi:hypothetical protein